MDGDNFWVIILIIFGIFVVAAIVALVYLSKRSKEQERLSEMRINQLAMNIPPDKAPLFMMQYQNTRKDPSTAVILALLLGGVGGHKFYLGQTFLGILYLLFSWTTIPSWIALFEAFGLAGKVAQINEEKASQIAAMLRY